MASRAPFCCPFCRCRRCACRCPFLGECSDGWGRIVERCLVWPWWRHYHNAIPPYNVNGSLNEESGVAICEVVKMWWMLRYCDHDEHAQFAVRNWSWSCHGEFSLVLRALVYEVKMSCCIPALSHLLWQKSRRRAVFAVLKAQKIRTCCLGSLSEPETPALSLDDKVARWSNPWSCGEFSTSSWRQAITKYLN